MKDFGCSFGFGCGERLVVDLQKERKAVGTTDDNRLQGLDTGWTDYTLFSVEHCGKVEFCCVNERLRAGGVRVQLWAEQGLPCSKPGL